MHATQSSKQPVALVYARASADPSDQRISVDRQVKLSTARAQHLWPGAEVKVFRDDSVTAADPSVHRLGYTAFLAAVRSAPVVCPVPMSTIVFAFRPMAIE